MNRTAKIVILLVLLLAMAAGGVLFLGKYNEKKTAYDAALLSATESYDEAQNAYNAVSADTEAGQKLREDMVQQRLAEGEQEIAALKSEREALEAEAAEKQEELDALKADEQNVYYQTVYDALAEGKAKVEGYLAGGKGGAEG